MRSGFGPGASAAAAGAEEEEGGGGEALLQYQFLSLPSQTLGQGQTPE